MNLKILNKTIIELASGNQSNYNLTLLGTEAIADYAKDVEYAISTNQIVPSESTFKKNYTEEDKFFYLAQRIDINKGPELTEVGVGQLISGGKEIRRIRPIYYFRNSDKPSPSLNGPLEFFEDRDDKYVIVKNYLPTNIAEMFIQTNSVIVSGNEEYVPKAIEVKKNSILGRKDEEIESITIEEISSLGIEAIQKYTKQLILKSSQINVRKIKTKQLLLEPSASPDAKRGTIFYDESEDTLMYYTGESWRTLAWKED